MAALGILLGDCQGCRRYELGSVALGFLSAEG